MENTEVTGSPEEFRRKNRAFQEELCRIFAPYYCFCPDCPKEACCLIYNQPDEPCPAPRNVVDGIIHGLPAQQITRRRKFNRQEIAAGLRRQFGSSEAGSASAQNAVLMPCLELTDTGCRLPVGERPLTCILALCETFAKYMTWRDFGHYWGVSLKYLTYLTFHLRDLRAGLTELHHELRA